MIDNVFNSAAVSRSLEPSTSKPGKDDPARVKDAATQFESLLLAQMLKSMHQADGSGWMGTGDDQASSSAMELADEQFASALAASGGLGIAKMVVTGLQRQK
jgi:Rod binding domain-containing protein